MNKVLQLKIASMLLFWFGVVLQFLVLIRTALEYYKVGTILDEGTREYISQGLGSLGAINFSFYMFIHIFHIVFGYWLAKGRMKGAILGISISLYEIVPYLLPNTVPDLFTPYAMAIRVLFAFVIYLIISGRNELVNLRSENWRPWKNPRTISTQ